MTIFDFLLLIILIGFILFGIWFGVIHTLGALLGVLFGTFIASHLFEPLADTFSFFFGGNINISRIVIFTLIFIFFNRLVGFFFYLLEKTVEFFGRIPYLRTIYRVGGGVLGFVEGSLVLGMILFVTSRFPWNETISQALMHSGLARVFIGVAKVLVPLVPQVLRQLQGII